MSWEQHQGYAWPEMQCKHRATGGNRCQPSISRASGPQTTVCGYPSQPRLGRAPWGEPGRSLVQGEEAMTAPTQTGSRGRRFDGTRAALLAWIAALALLP